MVEKSIQVIGRANYGSIGHLPGSKMADGRDKGISIQQSEIITKKPRNRADWKDVIYAQEKLDGANMGIARQNGDVFVISRAGYLASESNLHHHREFAANVEKQKDRFLSVLQDGERMVVEYLGWAHGIKYNLPHEDFVVLDIMKGKERVPLLELTDRVNGLFTMPKLLYSGNMPITVDEALILLGEHGHHGAIDPAEGVVFRVESTVRGKGTLIDFLAKYVRPEMNCGQYITKDGPLFRNMVHQE